MQKRKSVFCHVEGLSCGRPCGQPLSCGRHTCDRACHQDECLQRKENQDPNSISGPTCKQRCKKPREGSCGHPCAAPCHDGDCPATPCKEKLQVKCACGHLKATRLCGDQAAEFSRRQMSLMAAQVAAAASGGGGTVDLTAVMAATKSKGSNVTLECNEECAKVNKCYSEVSIELRPYFIFNKSLLWFDNN